MYAWLDKCQMNQQANMVEQLKKILSRFMDDCVNECYSRDVIQQCYHTLMHITFQLIFSLYRLLTEYGTLSMKIKIQSQIAKMMMRH